MNTVLIIFAACTAANVILGTIKSLMTIKGGKLNAAIWNALSFGLYSYIVVLTANAELSTATKVIVTIICNLVCVFGVKWVEEKLQKDRLWKFEITFSNKYVEEIDNTLNVYNIPHNYNLISKWVVFNIFCATKKESETATLICSMYDGKMFASETKLI